jgi:hypothetical protein
MLLDGGWGAHAVKTAATMTVPTNATVRVMIILA